jgi:hypothetical protein
VLPRHTSTLCRPPVLSLSPPRKSSLDEVRGAATTVADSLHASLRAYINKLYQLRAA